MIPISRQVRAYFAPCDRVSGKPSVFDPAKHGEFLLDAPPAPWVDLGWIQNFRRTSGTEVQALRSGARGTATAQVRRSLDAMVEFDFRQWGKLQMALAAGSEHMNVLESDPNTGSRPSGGIPLTGVAVLEGSSESELIVGLGTVDSFGTGDVLAVDVDYQQQAGYVGTGVAAAYVKDAADVQRDRDYVRRVTFNVARVAEKTATSLLLAQPLLGGVPPAGTSVQKIRAFVDREGGSFFQDWSGLFVVQDESGGRICFYYPRLSPTRPAGGKAYQGEASVGIQDPLVGIARHALFLAMPHADENDGQEVLCYRSYFPTQMSALY